MSTYTPQQAWSVAYSDTIVKQCGSIDLDSAFAKCRGEIKERAKILDKSLRLKITAWISKLSEKTNNEVWKKNRNAYAKLLLEQLKCGRLEEPFNVLPGSAPLPTLNKALLYPYTKPRTSGMSNCNNNNSKTEKPLQVTPSQLLDSYLSYHDGDDDVSKLAPPSSPIPIDILDSLTTPTSKENCNPVVENNGYINTAASHIHKPGHHVAAESSWDDDDARIKNPDSASGSGAVGHVELRLADAEERLRQHSTLLSLFLDITSSEHQIQKLELREQEQFGYEKHQRKQQPKRSVAQVLERAEVGRQQERKGPLIQSKRTEMSKPTSSSSRIHRDDGTLSTINKKERLGGVTFLSSPTKIDPTEVLKNISEKDLEQRLARFEDQTAYLKAKISSNFATVGSIAKENAVRKFTLPLNSTFAPVLEKDNTNSLNACDSTPTSPNSKRTTVSFIPSRHTLKSAAAAEATRKSLQADGTIDDGQTSGEDSLRDFRTRNTTTHNTTPHYIESNRANDIGIKDSTTNKEIFKQTKNLHKAAILLKPCPGSTTALVAEVAALRKRVAANLAYIEESQKDSISSANCGYGVGNDLYNFNNGGSGNLSYDF